MRRHIKNYIKATGLGEQDVQPCEIDFCSAIAVDIHHVTFKSQGGTDEYENLIGLCRRHHDEAHCGEITKEELYEIIDER